MNDKAYCKKKLLKNYPLYIFIGYCTVANAQ